MSEQSILEEYLTDHDFSDRQQRSDESVDVIIPTVNTNELWRKNLLSYYREIPIETLIIGDGGITDDTLEVAKEFPRVEVIDQRDHHTLGYCIQELMQEVSTEWFVYLHADVYLPPNWYDEMTQHQDTYDWFECYRDINVFATYWSKGQRNAKRAYSGSQMGRTSAFQSVLPAFDDDYLYRNEDLLFQDLIESNGYEYGKVDDTYHHHQVVAIDDSAPPFEEDEPSIEGVTVHRPQSDELLADVQVMQVKAIAKYASPREHLVHAANASLTSLYEIDSEREREVEEWIEANHPTWALTLDTGPLSNLRRKVKAVFKSVLQR